MKKLKSSFLLYSLLVATSLLVSACTFNFGEDPKGPDTPVEPDEPWVVHVTSVAFEKDSLTLNLNTVYQLKAQVLPANATNKEATWSSSNTAIVTVENGLVTAVGVGSSTVSVTMVDGAKTDYCEITVVDVFYPESTKTIDGSPSINYGNYVTNFGKTSFDYTEFGYYRANGSYAADIGIFYAHANLTNIDDGTIPGAFYNVDAISGIKSLKIDYTCESNICIKYGVDRTYQYETLLDAKSTSGLTTLTLERKANYFVIETTSENLYLNEVVITYDNSLIVNTNDLYVEGERIAPTTFDGTLKDGTSKVSVPTSISKVGGSYTVNSYKEYTYYSYDYVEANENSLNLDKIALTDPVDVANYYIAFKEIPANFGSKNKVSQNCGTVSEVKSLFGSDARCVSQYSRTDGYAVGLPYNTYQSTGKPLYYEFDIDVDGTYSTSSRGTGRVVVWIAGFSCYNDGAPIATLTTDHYCCFQEYLNYGSWGSPFDTKDKSTAERTGYLFQASSTLIKG
jgi:hypothetical protein